MDPLSALQSRIEQLEARLGAMPVESVTPRGADGVSENVVGAGESATESLLSAASCVNTATAGHDKLVSANERASELNNYMDPSFIQNIQESEIKTQEILASEPEIKHHCQCKLAYQKSAPVLDSAQFQAIPQLEPTLSKLTSNAAKLQEEVNQVSSGVQKLAETCGAAASASTNSLVNIAKKVQAAEAKVLPKRRNGLD